MGPAGAGKSALATQYALAAAERGENVAFFNFEESVRTLLARAEGLGQSLRVHVDSGRIRIQQIDPAELSPGEFASQVRTSVERDGTRVLIIDSLNGYLNAMPETRFLMLHLHELLMYLGQLGVVTFLVVAQHGMMGASMLTPVDTSYLADTVILLRFFEATGEIRQAVSVVKKRGGLHERSIRELRLQTGGIRVGEPLRDFHGILTGVPAFVGKTRATLGQGDEKLGPA
jgi:circadian clock protein KaiC